MLSTTKCLIDMNFAFFNFILFVSTCTQHSAIYANDWGYKDAAASIAKWLIVSKGRVNQQHNKYNTMDSLLFYVEGRIQTCAIEAVELHTLN